MEKHITIPTPDGKVIYGILNERKKSKTVLLIVHGRTGTALDPPGLMAARFFPRKNISTFRVSLYFWKKGSRSLMKSTTHQHGKDIDTVVKYLRKKYARVFVAGHSWGGPSIWFSDMNSMDGVVLWDPSSDMRKANEGFHYDPRVKAYLVEHGWMEYIPKKMYDESQKYSTDKLARLLRSVKVPTKFIMAGKGMWVNDGKTIYDSLSSPKSFVVIPNAGHHFAEESSESRLFNETLSWIRKFS